MIGRPYMGGGGAVQDKRYIIYRGWLTSRYEARNRNQVEKSAKRLHVIV